MSDTFDTKLLSDALGWCSLATSRIVVNPGGHPAWAGKLARDVVFSHELFHYFHLNGTPCGMAVSSMTRAAGLEVRHACCRLAELGCDRIYLPLTRWLEVESRLDIRQSLREMTERCQLIAETVTMMLGGKVSSVDELVARYRGAPPCVWPQGTDPRFIGQMYALGLVHILEGFASLADVILASSARLRGEVSEENLDRFVSDSEVRLSGEYRLVLAVMNKFFDHLAIPTTFAVCDLALQGMAPRQQNHPRFVDVNHPGRRLMVASREAAQFGDLPFSAMNDTAGHEYGDYVDRLSRKAFPDYPTPTEIAQIIVSSVPENTQSPWDSRGRNISALRLRRPSVLAFPWLFWRELMDAASPWWVNSTVKLDNSGHRVLKDAFVQQIASGLLSESHVICPDFLRSACHFKGCCAGKWPGGLAIPRKCALSLGFRVFFGHPLDRLASLDVNS